MTENAGGLREYLRLLEGEEGIVSVLAKEGRYSIQTPFAFPGRGPLTIHLSARDGVVRVSEGGELLRYLESQGMDLSIDPVISRTVWHAAKELGGKLGGGELFVECEPARTPQVVAEFTQVILEIVGLRHCKYKDAIVKLERSRGPGGPPATLSP